MKTWEKWRGTSAKALGRAALDLLEEQKRSPLRLEHGVKGVWR